MCPSVNTPEYTKYKHAMTWPRNHVYNFYPITYTIGISEINGALLFVFFFSVHVQDMSTCHRFYVQVRSCFSQRKHSVFLAPRPQSSRKQSGLKIHAECIYDVIYVVKAFIVLHTYVLSASSSRSRPSSTGRWCWRVDSGKGRRDCSKESAPNRSPSDGHSAVPGQAWHCPPQVWASTTHMVFWFK